MKKAYQLISGLALITLVAVGFSATPTHAASCNRYDPNCMYIWNTPSDIYQYPTNGYSYTYPTQYYPYNTTYPTYTNQYVNSYAPTYYTQPTYYQPNYYQQPNYYYQPNYYPGYTTYPIQNVNHGTTVTNWWTWSW